VVVVRVTSPGREGCKKNGRNTIFCAEVVVVEDGAVVVVVEVVVAVVAAPVVLEVVKPGRLEPVEVVAAGVAVEVTVVVVEAVELGDDPWQTPLTIL
jgi:hypothetical protein